MLKKNVFVPKMYNYLIWKKYARLDPHSTFIMQTYILFYKYNNIIKFPIECFGSERVHGDNLNAYRRILKNLDWFYLIPIKGVCSLFLRYPTNKACIKWIKKPRYFRFHLDEATPEGVPILKYLFKYNFHQTYDQQSLTLPYPPPRYTAG